jgi:SagB-type dehydrogenase family enzyme
MNSLKRAVFLTFCAFCHSMAQISGSIQLPTPQIDKGKPLMQVFAMRHSSRYFDKKPLELQTLSNLLWAAYGINRSENGKRTAPSAMNWQEIDIYVVMEKGTYLYNARKHSLVTVSSKDLRGVTGTQPFVKDAPVNLLFIADEKKMVGAGDEDKSKWSAADAGCIAQNVYLYCASEGLAAVVRGLFDRAVIAKALDLRIDQKILLAQTVGYPGQ